MMAGFCKPVFAFYLGSQPGVGSDRCLKQQRRKQSISKNKALRNVTDNGRNGLSSHYIILH